jgi:hypothetical protein
MQSKQKLTVYISPKLHKQLKVRAAIEIESMSSLVQQAVAFYLENPEQVEEIRASQGRSHQVHICPECSAAMVKREGEMVSLKHQPNVVTEEIALDVRSKISSNSQGEENLVPC